MADDGYATGDLADSHDRRRRYGVCARDRQSARATPTIRLGALAADVMATAVVRAATQATGLPNLPAVRDLKD